MLVVSAQCLLFLLAPNHAELRATVGAVGWLSHPNRDFLSYKTQTDPRLASIADEISRLVPEGVSLAFLTRRRDTDYYLYRLGYMLPRTRIYEYVYAPDPNAASALAAMDRAQTEWLVVLDDPEALEAILGSDERANSALLRRRGNALSAVATF